MTGKTKEMSKIKQLLIMHRDGASNRSIARVLGMDKETVNNYVNKTKALPEGLEGLLGLEDPELERRLHSGNAAYSDTRFDGLKETYAGSISRLIKDTMEKKWIKPLDPTTARRYMKYIPSWA